MNNKWVTRKISGQAYARRLDLLHSGPCMFPRLPRLRLLQHRFRMKPRLSTELIYRVDASTATPVIRLVKTGENVHVVGQANANWLHVFTKDGMSGYISAKISTRIIQQVIQGALLIPAAPLSPGGLVEPVAPSKADQVISISQLYIGKISYVFGVRNPDNLIFDCSSFTQFVFAQVGVTLKWGTSSQQSARQAVTGTTCKRAISSSSTRSASMTASSTMSGIYMGNGQFIQNSPSGKGGLIISSTETGYWANHYVSARRVL